MVAVADPAEVVRMTVAECGAKAAMLNCQSKRSQLRRLGAKPGELLVVHDDEITALFRALVVIAAPRLISFSCVRFTTL